MEIGKYQSAFVLYAKVRKGVKIRYAAMIDNREDETQMQNLLDSHLSVVGLKQLTNPADIMSGDNFEK